MDELDFSKVVLMTETLKANVCCSVGKSKSVGGVEIVHCFSVSEVAVSLTQTHNLHDAKEGSNIFTYRILQELKEINKCLASGQSSLNGILMSSFLP